jgi:TonB family protein
MGTITTPEHEILEGETRNREPLETAGARRESNRFETTAGAAEHNGRMDWAAGKPRPQQPGVQEPAATMANEILSPPETDTPGGTALVAGTEGHELDSFLGKAFEEKPIWTGLYESIRDVFFPQRLPPLVLTSTPIPVPDRMKVKPNPLAIGISTAVNGAILAVLLFFVGRTIINAVTKPPENNTNIDVGTFQFKGPKGDQAGGGGGGGDHSIVDPIKGRLPKREKNPVEPPQTQTVEKPLLPVDPAIDVQKNLTLPDNPSLPNIGVTKSANVQLASNGEGGGTGIGTGYGGGIGSGNGNGYGPGSGGNAGGGLYKVGGGISAPVPINAVEAEFSDEARRAKYQGVCIVAVIVDAQGNPQNPHISRALGMGLDEKALEAVRKYKFKPAMKKDGTAVPVMIYVEVNFRLY